MSSILPIPTSRINYLETRLDSAERMLALQSQAILDNSTSILQNSEEIAQNTEDIAANSDLIAINQEGVSYNLTHLVNKTMNNDIQDAFTLTNTNGTVLSFHSDPLKITGTNNTVLMKVSSVGDTTVGGSVYATEGVSAKNAYLSNGMLADGNIKGAKLEAVSDIKAGGDVTVSGDITVTGGVSAASLTVDNVDLGGAVTNASSAIQNIDTNIGKIEDCVASIVTILKNMGMVVTAAAVLDGALQLTAFAQQEVSLLTNSHSLTATPSFYSLQLGNAALDGSGSGILNIKYNLGTVSLTAGQLANIRYILSTQGGTMNGLLTLGTEGLRTDSQTYTATQLKTALNAANAALPLTGGTMTGALTLASAGLTTDSQTYTANQNSKQRSTQRTQPCLNRVV
jgi:hypothetical protein